MVGSLFCLCTVTNSILFGNTAGEAGPQIYTDSPASTPVVTYSLVEGGYPGDGPGLIDADPLFAGPEDLSLTCAAIPDECSPCIDSADDAAAPSTEIDGKERADVADYGATIADMGALEYQPSQ
jgi:hypothetical protein